MLPSTPLFDHVAGAVAHRLRALNGHTGDFSVAGQELTVAAFYALLERPDELGWAIDETLMMSYPDCPAVFDAAMARQVVRFLLSRKAAAMNGASYLDEEA